MALDLDVTRAEHTLNPSQYTAIGDVTSRVLVLQGGWRSGKTHALCCKVLDLSRRNPGKVGVFAAPTWSMVEQVFVEEMRLLCALTDVAMAWNGQKGVLTLFRRRPVRVICRSLDRPRSGEGLTVAWAVIDEWELCNPTAIKTINARITKGDVSQLVLGGTPESFGPAYSMMLAEPRPGTRVITMPTRENADNLNDGYLEDTGAILDDDEKAEKLEGIRTAKGGLVYRRFDRVLCFGRRAIDEREPHSIELWCDFNIGAHHWLIVEVSIDRRRFHVGGEVIGYDVDTDQHAGRALHALASYMSKRGSRRVTADDVAEMKINAPCDSSGRNRGALASHVRVLSSHGFRPLYFSRGNPDVEDRVFSVNQCLAARPLALTVDEKAAPFLARALQQQGRDASGAPAKHKDPAHDLSGPVDALGYGVWWHRPSHRYKPNSTTSPENVWAEEKRRQETRFFGQDVIR